MYVHVSYANEAHTTNANPVCVCIYVPYQCMYVPKLTANVVHTMYMPLMPTLLSTLLVIHVRVYNMQIAT